MTRRRLFLRPAATRLVAGLLLLAATAGISVDRPPEGAATTPTVFDDPALVMHYQESITANRLSSLLHEIASDEFEGRETGTLGQHRAAAWLAQYYLTAGILPASSRTSELHPTIQDYMQPVPVYGRELEQSTLTVHRSEARAITYSYAPRDSVRQMYLAYGTVQETTGPVEFHGNRFADGTLEYAEYAALQRASDGESGTWVMAFAPDSLIHPAERDGAHRSTSVWPRLRFQTGIDTSLPLPVGYLLIAPDEDVRTIGARVAEQALSVGALSLSEPTSTYPFPPVYVMTADAADSVLRGTGHSIERFRDRLAHDHEPIVQPVKGINIRSKIDFPVRLFDTANVIAWIEGTDPELKDEVILLSSHYDHIGVNPLLEGNNIYNGADDNGSGTVAMLEIARAFAMAKSDGLGPRRSIAFAHFTGEEKGLLGSAYYADVDPVFPLDRTVTNINIDMIGRFDPSHPHLSENYVYIIGSRLISEELHHINERVNRLTGIDVELDERFNTKKDPNRYYRRSDHWNFGKHGIPFIFFFTGSHEDYHRPEDEAHKIEYERMTRIARLIFATTWQVANQDSRPRLSGEGFN